MLKYFIFIIILFSALMINPAASFDDRLPGARTFDKKLGIFN